MNITELQAESAELLPGREALAKLKFSFVKTTSITKHVNVANVDATNLSAAANYGSFGATAASEAAQSINIAQS